MRPIAMLLFILLAPPSSPSHPSVRHTISLMESNIAHFNAAVPDFSCEEDIRDMKLKKNGRRKIVVSATTSLWESHSFDKSGDFVEHREFLTYNGKPVRKKQKTWLPLLISNTFSSASDPLGVIAAHSCFNFTVTNSTDGNIRLKFTSKTNPPRSAHCFLQSPEWANGYMIVDSKSGQPIYSFESISNVKYTKNATMLTVMAYQSRPVKIGQGIYILPYRIYDQTNNNIIYQSTFSHFVYAGPAITVLPTK